MRRRILTEKFSDKVPEATRIAMGRANYDERLVNFLDSFGLDLNKMEYTAVPTSEVKRGAITKHMQDATKLYIYTLACETPNPLHLTSQVFIPAITNHYRTNINNQKDMGFFPKDIEDKKKNESCKHDFWNLSLEELQRLITAVGYIDLVNNVRKDPDMIASRANNKMFDTSGTKQRYIPNAEGGYTLRNLDYGNSYDKSGYPRRSLTDLKTALAKYADKVPEMKRKLAMLQNHMVHWIQDNIYNKIADIKAEVLPILNDSDRFIMKQDNLQGNNTELIKNLQQDYLTVLDIYNTMLTSIFDLENLGFDLMKLSPEELPEDLKQELAYRNNDIDSIYNTNIKPAIEELRAL